MKLLIYTFAALALYGIGAGLLGGAMLALAMLGLCVYAGHAMGRGGVLGACTNSASGAYSGLQGHGCSAWGATGEGCSAAQELVHAGNMILAAQCADSL